MPKFSSWFFTPSCFEVLSLGGLLTHIRTGFLCVVTGRLPLRAELPRTPEGRDVEAADSEPLEASKRALAEVPEPRYVTGAAVKQFQSRAGSEIASVTFCHFLKTCYTI